METAAMKEAHATYKMYASYNKQTRILFLNLAFNIDNTGHIFFKEVRLRIIKRVFTDYTD